MKKLIVLFVLVAFVGYASAELHELTQNLGFESSAGMGGWSSWGSGSGSGPSGSGWKSHWAYVETTGGHSGQNFMVPTTDSQLGYSEYWGWGYNVVWRGASSELLDWTLQGDVGQVTMGSWAKDLSGNGGTHSMAFEWIDASGNSDGGGNTIFLVAKTEVQLAVTTDWAYYETVLAVPAGIYGVRPVWGAGTPGSLLGFDDVTAVWTIPEPMSIALLGLGGLFLRRRK